MSSKKYIPFKVRYDFQERKAKHAKFTQQDAGRNVVLIIQPLGNSTLQHFENCKFIIDREKTLNYFKSIIHSKLGSEAHKHSLFLFVGKKLLHEGQMSMGDIYEKYSDQDGFLYINYAENNPF